MVVRPFDWRDIATLHRHRNRCVFLDSALVLTRGALLVPGALLSYLVPAMGVLTFVVDNDEGDDSTLIGQVIHVLGAPFSHLTFLAPDEALEAASIVKLLEYMVGVSAGRGALRLLADVDERTLAFDALRRNGFAIFARQRIWQISDKVEKTAKGKSASWRSAKPGDVMAIRLLYNNLVPGLVQQVEPFTTQRPRGIVFHNQGDLLAYVELKYGPRGIWVHPFIHPDAEEVQADFLEFLQKIPKRRSRPVYICIRSYQSWLEPALEDLGAQVGSRQAVMVKHLAVQQKATRTFALPALEGGQPEVTAPIARLETE